MIDGKMVSIRSSWNTSAMLIKGPLTDRKINKYREQGWYSSEFRALRKKKMDQQKMKHHNKRISNFFESEGRLIYSPL